MACDCDCMMRKRIEKIEQMLREMDMDIEMLFDLVGDE